MTLRAHRVPSFIVPIVAVAIACGCNAPKPVIPLPATERELVSTSRAIPGEAALNIVGLRPRAEKDDAATTWDSRFDELPFRVTLREVKRPFEFVLVNRAASPRRFDVTIRYERPDGTLIRARTFRKLVIPPFTEKTYRGYSRFAKSVSARATMEAAPLDEEDG